MRFRVYHWVGGQLPLDWKQNQVVELLPEEVMKLSEDWDVMIQSPPVRAVNSPGTPPFDRWLFIDNRGRRFAQR